MIYTQVNTSEYRFCPVNGNSTGVRLNSASKSKDFFDHPCLRPTRKKKAGIRAYPLEAVIQHRESRASFKGPCQEKGKTTNNNLPLQFVLILIKETPSTAGASENTLAVA